VALALEVSSETNAAYFSVCAESRLERMGTPFEFTITTPSTPEIVNVILKKGRKG
jgi:hypothetical protein